jgi:hypothetical protein
MCRAGPFSYEGFRQAISEGSSHEISGYCYTTTWPVVARSISNEICSWCRILRRARDGLPTMKYPPACEESVEVTIKISTEKLQEGVEIYLNGSKAASYAIYANLGE